MTRKALNVALLALAALACAPEARSTSTSLQPYGVATAGSGGFAPQIWTMGTAFPGNSGFQLTLDKALGGSAAMLLLSPAPATFPIMGITLNVQPWFVSPPVPAIGSGPGGGAAQVPFPIPLDASLLGAQVYCQWVVADPGAPTGLSASKGLAVQIVGPPRVLACGSAGTLDPFVEVDPLSGAVTSWGIGANNPVDVQITPDGNMAVVTASRTFIIADMSGSSLGAVSVNGVPNSVAITPDGKRCYGIVGGTQTANNGKIIEIDLDPTSATFGTQLATVSGFPSALTQLEGVQISGDGKTLTTCNLGLGQQAAIFIVDVDPLSPTFNSVRYRIDYGGGLLTDIAPTSDGSMAYCTAASLGGASHVVVVDCRIGVIVNLVQGLGYFTTDIEIDALDRFAVIACPNSDEIQRLNTDMSDPGYLTVVSTTYPIDQPFAVALSPDSSTFYCTEQGGDEVLQFDARTMAFIQSWVVGTAAYAAITSR